MQKYIRISMYCFTGLMVFLALSMKHSFMDGAWKTKLNRGLDNERPMIFTFKDGGVRISLKHGYKYTQFLTYNRVKDNIDKTGRSILTLKNHTGEDIIQYPPAIHSVRLIKISNDKYYVSFASENYLKWLELEKL